MIFDRQCSRHKSRQLRDESCSVDLAANIKDGCEDRYLLEDGCEDSCEDGCEVAMKEIGYNVGYEDGCELGCKLVM